MKLDQSLNNVANWNNPGNQHDGPSARSNIATIRIQDIPNITEEAHRYQDDMNGNQLRVRKSSTE